MAMKSPPLLSFAARTFMAASSSLWPSSCFGLLLSVDQAREAFPLWLFVTELNICCNSHIASPFVLSFLFEDCVCVYVVDLAALWQQRRKGGGGARHLRPAEHLSAGVAFGPTIRQRPPVCFKICTVGCGGSRAYGVHALIGTIGTIDQHHHSCLFNWAAALTECTHVFFADFWVG